MKWLRSVFGSDRRDPALDRAKDVQLEHDASARRTAVAGQRVGQRVLDDYARFDGAVKLKPRRAR